LRRQAAHAYQGAIPDELRRGAAIGSGRSNFMTMLLKVPQALATPAAALDNSVVASLADALNTILADSFALYFKTKNFHWHVSGPHFRDYHLLLDDQATQIFAVTDAIAERVRKIGATTLRSVNDIGRRQTISDNDAPYVTPRAMLTELRYDNLTLIEALRGAKVLADAAGDNASSGIIDTWTDEAEQRAWFLFEASRE
jgi:starvation-inducible DNA-binding protein